MPGSGLVSTPSSSSTARYSGAVRPFTSSVVTTVILPPSSWEALCLVSLSTRTVSEQSFRPSPNRSKGQTVVRPSSARSPVELPRDRCLTGGAIDNCFGQIGAVLGISTLIVVIGSTAAVTGLTGVALGRVRTRNLAGAG